VSLQFEESDGCKETLQSRLKKKEKEMTAHFY
jgi:hypothetical protein